MYHDAHDMWTYSCKTYEKETIRKAEEILCPLLKKKTLFQSSECHPEMDTSNYWI